MIDIDKQVEYWLNGAAEDWQVAQELVNRGRVRHGLFFAQLTLEKTLKAYVCRQTQDLAPRIHNLVRLAELAKLLLEQSQFDLLAEMNAFNIEGRYPDLQLPMPSLEEAQDYLKRAGEVYQWLTSRLYE
jgi:HEPN domain-containing protein